jgi:hypothetical protein
MYMETYTGIDEKNRRSAGRTKRREKKYQSLS